MAISLPFDISFGLLSGSASNFLSAVIGILIILSFLWVWMHLGKKGEHHREAKAERKASGHFSKLGAAIKANMDTLKRDKAAEKVEEKEIEGEEKSKENGSKGKEKKAVRAAEKAEKAVETDEGDEKRIEQDAEELERETVAIVADTQILKDEIHTEVEHELLLTQVEEKEVVILEALESRIGNINAFGAINKEVAVFLNEYFKQLVMHTAKEVEYERAREISRSNVVSICRDVIGNMTHISNYAKSEVRNLTREQRKEKRHFKRELQTLNKALNAKRKEINSEIRKGKKGDPTLIIQLKKEVDMLKKNKATLEIVSGQLEKTHELLGVEIGQLKDLMRSIVRTARSEKRKDKTLKRREKKIPKTVKHLEKYQGELSENINKLEETSGLHGAALQLSIKLKNYFDHYEELLTEDKDFANILEDLLRTTLEMERKIETLSPLIDSILESSEALENGTAALIEILAMMLSDDVSSEIKTQAATIQEEVAILEKQKNLDKTLEAIEKEVEKGLLQDMAMVEKLRMNITKLIAENQELFVQESSHLAKTMATTLASKEALTQGYEKTTNAFAEKLQERNAAAGEAFNRARKAA